MPEDLGLQEAIDAITQGQQSRARDLITRLLQANPENPTYWLWMSAVVETKKECIFCLKKVLQLDPDNRLAKKGLVLLDEVTPQETTVRPLVKRKWETVQFEIPLASQKSYKTRDEFKKILKRFGMLLVLFFSLVYLTYFFMFGGSSARAPLTVTPVLWTVKPTATLLPTNTPYFHTSTPTFTGPAPLWMLLEATYTPTPLYVNTPHPISEAYQAGLRAMQAADFSSMLQFMQQASHVEPQSADLHYYIGEAYRLMGIFDKALAAYEQAITIDADFAPAYLGKAHVQLLLNPTTEVLDNLKQALVLDPYLAEAYLVLAEYYLSSNNAESALRELTRVENLLPHSPLLYLYRAQAYLLLGQYTPAMEAAVISNHLDLTLLPTYRVLGEAYLWNSEASKAVEVLHIYTTYVDDDAFAWYLLGRSLHQEKKLQQALDAFERALSLDETLEDAYLYRGLTYIGLGEGQKAVNDLYYALRLNPDSFYVNLEFAHALFVAGRAEDALGQINHALTLAEDTAQKIKTYFLRAQIYEQLGETFSAIRDWQEVLDLISSLPKDIKMSGEEQIAREHLFMLLPKTPTFTPTKVTTQPINSLTATFSFPRMTNISPPETIATRQILKPSPTITP